MMKVKAMGQHFNDDSSTNYFFSPYLLGVQSSSMAMLFNLLSGVCYWLKRKKHSFLLLKPLARFNLRNHHLIWSHEYHWSRSGWDLWWGGLSHKGNILTEGHFFIWWNCSRVLLLLPSIQEFSSEWVSHI
jgi:hypothetical protein